MVQVNEVLSHFTLVTSFHKAYLLSAQNRVTVIVNFSQPYVQRAVSGDVLSLAYYDKQLSDYVVTSAQGHGYVFPLTAPQMALIEAEAGYITIMNDRQPYQDIQDVMRAKVDVIVSGAQSLSTSIKRSVVIDTYHRKISTYALDLGAFDLTFLPQPLAERAVAIAFQDMIDEARATQLSDLWQSIFDSIIKGLEPSSASAA
jgi:hypothetical protein